MLPQDKFSNITTPSPYPYFGFQLPPKKQQIQAVNYGGKEIGQVNEGYVYRYWVAYQVGSKVMVAPSDNEEWLAGIEIFTEALPVAEISLAFDQVGRPTVFYRVGGDLKLFWYDSQAGAQEITTLNRGSYPIICFDIPTMPSDPSSDMILFYKSNHNKLCYRYQRDRFAIEYVAKRVGSDKEIKGAGLAIYKAAINSNNRLQVEYEGDD